MAHSSFMFTKLIVLDLERVAQFYVAVAELSEMRRLDATISGRNVSEIVFQPGYPGGPMLILAKFHDMTALGADESILGFSTDNLEAFLERVVAAGGEIVEPIREMPEANLRNAFFKDPEGHWGQASQMVAA